MQTYQASIAVFIVALTLPLSTLGQETQSENFTQKFEETRKKAEAGDPVAMFCLGSMYRVGKEAPQDVVKAKEWLEKASKSRDEGIVEQAKKAMAEIDRGKIISSPPVAAAARVAVSSVPQKAPLFSIGVKRHIDTQDISYSDINKVAADVSVVEVEWQKELFGKKTALPNANGVFVLSTYKSGPADTAGIKSGDFIIQVGKNKVSNCEEFRKAIEEVYKSGEKCMVVGYHAVKQNQSSNSLRWEKYECEIKLLTMRDVLMLSMEKTEDKIEGIVWIKDRSMPGSNDCNDISAYIGIRGGRTYLRWKFRYAGRSWLFIKDFTIVSDEKRLDVKSEFERDHNTHIWEWCDIPVQEKELEMINSIIGSKESVIRYRGMQYNADREITQQEKDALKRVVFIYKSLTDPVK